MNTRKRKIHLTALLLTLVMATIAQCHSIFTEFEDSASCSSTAEGAFQAGSGVSSDPYLICTASQLAEISNNLAAHFKQGQDIDLGCSAFTPMGSVASPFTGSFNGAGYTINNLCISLPTIDNVALFAVTNGASLSQVSLANGQVTGRENTALLVGSATATTFSAITIQGTSNGGFSQYTALMAAKIDSSTVDLCRLQGDATTVASYVGLVTASATNGSSIQRCWASGTVDGAASTGGLVGLLSQGSTLAASMVTDTTVRAIESPGGLVGESQDATISASLAHLTLIHRLSGINLYPFGALVGKVTGTAVQTNIYASYAILDGVTSANPPDETIVGVIDAGNAANVVDCYTQDTTSAGGILATNGGTLKTDLATSLKAATSTDYNDGSVDLVQTSTSGAPFTDHWALFSFANDGNYPGLSF